MTNRPFSTQKIIQDAADQMSERVFDIALKHANEGQAELILNGVQFREEVRQISLESHYEVLEKLTEAVIDLLKKE